MERILVIDQGTHASRCLLFDLSGQLLEKVEHPVHCYRHNRQFIEQNAEEILASVYFCLDQLQKNSGLENIISAALVTQRSTIVAWHRESGKVLSEAISWQDTRGADQLPGLMPEQTQIRSVTGLPLSAHYGATKISWLLQHNELCQQAAADQQLVIAPLASYLLEQLTGITEPVIDHVNAQRTQLLDIKTLQWSESMLKLFAIEPHCLPKLKPCLSDYGYFRHHDIPLKLVIGDQNAAQFANGSLPEDALLINIGTGAFVIKQTQRADADFSLLNGLTFSSKYNTVFSQEGTVNGAGAAISTLYDEIEETMLFEQLPDWLTTVQAPPVFINSVSGLGSPWWNNAITPHYLGGNDQRYELAERAVAIIESIIFLLQANIDRLIDAKTKTIQIAGGLSNLDGLCQKLANLSQLPVQRSANTEATAVGAAWLLSQQLPDHHWSAKSVSQSFEPRQDNALHSRYKLFNEHLVKTMEKQLLYYQHAVN